MPPRRKSKQAFGGRILQVEETSGVAIVNRSNRDAFFQDPSPPHGLVCLRAGDFSPETWQHNFVQFFTLKAAKKALAVCGEQVEFLGIEDGKVLLRKARELRDADAAYDALRAPEKIMDFSQHPAEVAARDSLTKRMKAVGFRKSDIPAKASINALRKLYTDYMSGRQHLEIRSISVTPEQEEIGGRIEPIDLRQPAENARTRQTRESLRAEIDEYGVAWNPSHKVPALRAQLEALRETKAADTDDDDDADDFIPPPPVGVETVSAEEAITATSSEKVELR